jgi:predicted dehydrogenase
MKICFFGLGSIGKRHLKNVTRVLGEYGVAADIHAFRKTRKALEDNTEILINHEIFSEEGLCDDYDIVFVTNPTRLHYDTIRLMANKTKHMFIEKPVFDSREYDTAGLNLRDDGIYYVAGPLKYSKVLQQLKQILATEKVYGIRAICSSYLPDWRPGVDYREVYSARKSEGGGVSIDLIHEWDYLTSLFGFPEAVFNFRGKYSHLEIDSDDISVYIARYKDKLAEIHLDYFGRVPKREVELYTESGIIIGDFISKAVRFSDSREDIRFEEDNDKMYMEEMRYFIDKVINGSKSDNGINHAYRLLRLADGRL